MPVKALFLICLLALAGCGGTAQPAAPASQPTAPASTPEVPPAEEPPPASEFPTTHPAVSASGGDARQAVVAALSAQVTGGPYRTTMVVEGSGEPMRTTSEAVPPSRYRIASTIGAETTEMVIIDDTIWMKNGGAWVARDSQGSAAAVRGMNTPAEIDAMVGEAGFVGQESLDGVPALVYTYTATFGEGEAAATSASTLWVAVETGLPIKSVGVADVGGATTTTQTIVYDDSISIEAPE